MSASEIVLPLPVPRDRVIPATQFRSTWLVASLQGLRAGGHFARYERRLAAEHRDAILHCVAGTWLPMRVATAHYEACQSLGLTMDEQLQMGDAVGGRGSATLISTVSRAAKSAGVTPWAVFPQLDRIWRRGANGGAVTVARTGPKEALGEVVGCALFDLPYFRNAFRGVVHGMTRGFCSSMYVREAGPRPPGEVRLRFQWS